MGVGDVYRAKAAEFLARARQELGRRQRRELESLGRAYLRLAEQADRNSHADISYETRRRSRRPR